MEVSFVLKRMREQRGLTQEELATRAMLDRTYISMLERNIRAPSLATMQKLASGLEMKLWQLIKLVETTN